MSQKVTRKKRLKPSQSASSLSKKQDSDIAKYFESCLTFVSDKGGNDENHLLAVQEVLELENIAPKRAKLNTNSKPAGTKSKTDPLDLLIPQKEWEAALAVETKSRTSSNLNCINNLSRESNRCSSLAKSQKFFLSSRNKSDVFNNITSSFTSSKILSLQALSNIDSQRRLELTSWGLPPLILEKYEARGIKSMFPWQVECLANRKILEENKNLVYSAPTSAGKTLVAEFLVLKTVLERRKKAIFILPFVSVVREKMFYFQDLLSDSGVRVEGFMGGIAPAGGFSSVHVAIATIEKANSLINRLMETGDLVTLGAVVIDELHLLGDPSRGYLLELLLTKLRYMTLSVEHIDIQLIGMSATLPNLPLIADWLNAELYKTDFRPIPLNEQCKIGASLYDNKLNVIRELQTAPDIVSDTDNIIQLCIETINGGHGVLIFCPTKNWCEKLATQVASTFFQLGRDNTYHGQILRKNINLESVQEILIQLQHCPVGLDNVLKRTVSFGVAFHHAGLTMDERDIVEGAFRVGSLKVLMATSTLSSGVNLPARRVIIRSPMFNGKLIDKLTYQQMIGRAGRMGKDTAGESILICKQNERAAAVKLMTGSLEPIESCLEGSGPLIRALLEAVASQIVRTPRDLDFYSKCTFVYKFEDNEVKEMVEEAVKFLISNEFLQVKDAGDEEQRMVATCLGKACLAASITPRDGLFLFEELQRARKCFVLDTELHVVYLVTPFNAGSQINQIDWMIFLELWRSLSESERRVGHLVGVEERFLMTAMRGIVKPGKTLNIHRRFYTALALHDLVREVSLNTVCRKYNCCRGLLQSLQQSSSTFAGMVTNFCKELKWDCMELLFAQFQARLQFGVCRDLLDLLRLPSLNGLRARSLFKNGITTVAELAVANELDVEEALNKALPFESEKDFDGGNEAEIAKRNMMRTVFITGKDGLTAREAAQIVIKEARILVKHELGVDVKWSQDNKENNKSNPVSPTKNLIISRSPSIISDGPSRNTSIHIHADDLRTSKIEEKLMDVEEEDDKKPEEKIVENVKQRKTNNESSPVLPDAVNENNELHTTSKVLRSNPSEKTKSIEDAEKTPESDKHLSKDFDKISTSPGEITNTQTVPRSLRSKLAEKSRSLLKEDHFTICSMDFQDTEDCHKDPPFKAKGNSQKNESLLVFSQEVITGNNKPQEVFKEVHEANLPVKTNLEKTPESEKRLSDNSDRVSTSPKDVINISDKPLTSSRSLRSKLAERKKSQLNNDHITIRSTDFQDSTIGRLEQSIKSNIKTQKAEDVLQNKVINQPLELFQVSDRVLNEIVEVVEGENKDPFVVPAPVVDVKANEEKKRDSAGSNYSKSPSLFSDSSFLDAQICSMLEKNVLDQTYFAEFEKSKLTPQNQNQNQAPKSCESSKTSRNIAVLQSPISKEITNAARDCKNDQIKEKLISNNIQNIENKENNLKQMSVPMTWTEDSWDQTKNLRDDKNRTMKENAGMDSPSLLGTTRMRTRLKHLSSTQIAFSKIQNSIIKDMAVDTTLIGTPKSTLQKRITNKENDKESPVAGIRTYNTRRPFLPIATSSNKSDSEDSVINSQTNSTRSITRNKTRSRIEQKLLSTQKLGKSTKVKSLATQTQVIRPASKLLKQNTEPFFKDSSSSDDSDTTESLMFDSDDTVKSDINKPKKKLKETSSVRKIKLLAANSCSSNQSNEEKISLKAAEPINVANSKRTFRLFRNEIENSAGGGARKDLAVAIVSEFRTKDPSTTIGNKIIGIDEKKKKEKKADVYVYGDKRVCGIVFSWGTKAVYYMPFSNSQETKITIKERMSFLRDILTNKSITLRCFDAKEVYKMLYTCCEIESCCRFLDPKTGDWLLNSETCHWSYSELTARYFPRGLDLANCYENNYGTYVLMGSARAGAKALLAWYITDAILVTIKEQSPVLLSAYKEVEMPTIITLVNMELRGFGINMTALQELSAVVKNDLSCVEEQAFSLAGKKFNFYSSKEVSQVLGLNKRGRGCTNKNALRSCENPISNLITLWRKLSTVQTKIIFPLLQLEKKNERIHGNCITYTVTGRVSMHEPNLQTIPRDFKSEISGCILSARMAFVPAEGNVILSADFCQLELRILAHFSQDPVLCKLMHEQGDIFKNIAARLNHVSDDMVDDDMRQRAKQLCYAMIYGMGTKSLAETLSVTESEAKDYLEGFMGTYKGIRVWLNAVYDQARLEGLVTTLADRRRILSGINSKISAVKSQAERQAVNTKVQGSAADITKKAMVMIESEFREKFSHLPLIFPTPQSKRKLHCSDPDSRPRGSYLILQLHDELLYEVNSNDLQLAARIVKDSMEHAYELRVPLPVKIKVGTAWGNLEEYQI